MDDDAATQLIGSVIGALAAMRRTDRFLTLCDAALERVVSTSPPQAVTDDVIAVYAMLGVIRNELGRAALALQKSDEQMKQQAERDRIAMVTEVDRSLAIYDELMARVKPGDRS